MLVIICRLLYSAVMSPMHLLRTASAQVQIGTRGRATGGVGPGLHRLWGATRPLKTPTATLI